MHPNENDPTPLAPPADILPKAQWLARAKIGKTTYDESYRIDLEARGRVWEDATGAHWMSAGDADAIRAERFRVARSKSARAERSLRDCPHCGEQIAGISRTCPHCSCEVRTVGRGRTTR